MANPSPTLVELARRIVEHETDGPPDPAAAAAAVENACRRLKDHLVDLLGSGGVSALLRRALHLAQREQSCWREVAVSSEPAACFIGLEKSLAACTEENATAVAAIVLTHMVDLLVILLGEELGMKPVRKLWPQASRAREIDE